MGDYIANHDTLLSALSAYRRNYHSRSTGINLTPPIWLGRSNINYRSYSSTLTVLFRHRDMTQQTFRDRNLAKSIKHCAIPSIITKCQAEPSLVCCQLSIFWHTQRQRKFAHVFKLFLQLQIHLLSISSLFFCQRDKHFGQHACRISTSSPFLFHPTCLISLTNYFPDGTHHAVCVAIKTFTALRVGCDALSRECRHIVQHFSCSCKLGCIP
mmetsp:Transcript_32563/g.55533  ORF Transcript_32563/g.55533 Transcript_32563/m.55533 type:complete len:212 (-) Transcript_32563:769-1404(-)